MFKHWLNLPEKFQNMIINKMDSESRWRFAKCAKMTHKIATTSKNYIHGVSFLERSLEEFQIRFFLTNIPGDINHFLKFVEEPEGKVRIHYYWSQPIKDGTRIIRVPREKWNVLVTGDCMSIAIEHLKKYLNKFETNLKELSICSKRFAFEDFKIQNMKNLWSISIEYNEPKVDLIECGFLDFEQILRASNYLYLPYTYICFEKLIQLNAKKIYTGVMNLTEKNLIDFVELWRAGKIPAKTYIWLWTRTDFNKFTKLQMLRQNVEKSASTVLKFRKPEEELTMEMLDSNYISFTFKRS